MRVLWSHLLWFFVIFITCQLHCMIVNAHDNPPPAESGTPATGHASATDGGAHINVHVTAKQQQSDSDKKQGEKIDNSKAERRRLSTEENLQELKVALEEVQNLQKSLEDLKMARRRLADSTQPPEIGVGGGGEGGGTQPPESFKTGETGEGEGEGEGTPTSQTTQAPATEQSERRRVLSAAGGGTTSGTNGADGGNGKPTTAQPTQAPHPYEPKRPVLDIESVASDNEKRAKEISVLSQRIDSMGAFIEDIKRILADTIKQQERLNPRGANLTSKDAQRKNRLENEQKMIKKWESMCPSVKRRESIEKECFKHDAFILDEIEGKQFGDIDDEHICFESDLHNNFWDCVCEKCPIPFHLESDVYEQWKQEFQKRDCIDKFNRTRFPEIGSNACEFTGHDYPKNVKPDEDKDKDKVPEDASSSFWTESGNLPFMLSAVALGLAMIGGFYLVVSQ